MTWVEHKHPNDWFVESGASVLGWVFLIVLTLNLIVLSFDFPRTTSLTIFFIGIAVILACMLIVVYQPGLFPWLAKIMTPIKPAANAVFYYVFTMALGAIYVAVLLNRRFDYWEVRPNELLHHHGFLSDLERLPAPNLRIDKEINDVFEFLLLGSGRLILHPSNEPRAIVLENVMFISRKEQAITRMLGIMQVQLKSDSP